MLPPNWTQIVQRNHKIEVSLEEYHLSIFPESSKDYSKRHTTDLKHLQVFQKGRCKSSHDLVTNPKEHSFLFYGCVVATM